MLQLVHAPKIVDPEFHAVNQNNAKVMCLRILWPNSLLAPYAWWLPSKPPPCMHALHVGLCLHGKVRHRGVAGSGVAGVGRGCACDLPNMMEPAANQAFGGK